ncbi:acyltransferase family protein [Streptomyces sp. NPDC048269]|uniref:acyltransferase family protein n=1 Tax=Streptomyces sp. NPDC048269 TaxID=3155753 RepID=UPI00342BF80F
MLLPAGLPAASWALASGTGQPFLFQGGLLLHSALAATLIALLAHALATPLARTLGSRPLTRFGGLSYGVYLWHWPLILLLDHTVPQLDGWTRTLCISARPDRLGGCGVTISWRRALSWTARRTHRRAPGFRETGAAPTAGWCVAHRVMPGLRPPGRGQAIWPPGRVSRA